MNAFINHLANSLCQEKGYSALFRAGAVLIGVALLAMSQTGPFLYEKDLAAHKAKFTLEVSQLQPLEKIDCSKLTANRVDCLMAKHEMQTLSLSLKLLDMFSQKCFWFGVFLVFMSCAGFLCAPHFAHKPTDVQD